MYHSRFKGNHYEAGYKWGDVVRRKGNRIGGEALTFPITEERRSFTKECKEIYKRYYPEIIEELQGIADGQQTMIDDIMTIVFSMYCFTLDARCTCMAYKTEDEILFGRNSDFLVAIEKTYDSCYYQLDNAYSFIGNTTAYVEIEDGINEYGLAIGLTAIYPKIQKPGFNAGMLVRYILEKCKTTKEAIEALYKLPIASAQTLTIADATGEIVVVECNSEKIVVIKPKDKPFVIASNNFTTKEMQAYKNPDIEDWYADKRYHVGYQALQATDKYSMTLVKEILAGKHGFMCQYDRESGADTVWSVIYNITNRKVYRVEGNPSRKQFKEDTRLKFKI